MSKTNGKHVGEATQASTAALGREVIAKGGNGGLCAVVGKLWYSPRRYGWALRFGEHPAVTTFLDGSRFELVEVIPA